MRKPPNINIKQLECMAGKEHAKVMFIGDIHLGHPTCLLDKVHENIKYCLNSGVYILGMGDYLECGLTGSIGDSVYTQKLNPQEQMDELIELFMPLAKSGLLLGLISGNHESRVFKTAGVDICRIMCDALCVPYLFSARWNLFKVGIQNYLVYSMHGSTGSTFAHTKLKAAADAARSFHCDVFAMGHTHDLVSNVVEEQAVDLRNKKVIYKRKLIMVTGHYLGYELSYAQSKGYQIGKTGSPTVKFTKDRHAFYI